MSNITDYFDVEIKYEYEFVAYIQEAFFDNTDGSQDVAISRLKKDFRNRKLTPTSRGFLMYLKYNDKFSLPERTFENNTLA